MKHNLRVGQLIKCARFKDAKYYVRFPDNAAPVLDKARLSMEGLSITAGAWHEEVEKDLFRRNSFSFRTATDGRFEDCTFKVLAVNLVSQSRTTVGHPTVAGASTGERILFIQGEPWVTGRIPPEDIELLDGPPDEPVEPVW